VIGIITGILIVVGFFYVGFQGFSYLGLPLYGGKRLRGRAARITGVCCIVFGSLLAVVELIDIALYVREIVAR
jgi:hypothetical protein